MVRQEAPFTFFPCCPSCSGEETKTVPQATEVEWVVLEGVKEEGSMGEDIVEEEVDGLPFPELRVLRVKDTASGETNLVH